jgi:uncharacterized protein YceK
MKTFAKTVLLVSLLLVAGCGTLLNLPDRNGEYYLACHSDCEAIRCAAHQSPYSWIQLGPVSGTLWDICWGLDLPLSIMTDTLLIPFDYYQGRRKGFYMLVVDDEGKPIPGVSIRGYSKLRVNGSTDAQGNFRWASDSRSIEWLELSKPGYYNTKQEPRRNRTITSELVASHTNVLSVVLRRIRNPVAMYAKQASVDLPSASGVYGYDLMIGDLVAPHGKGIVADFLFHVKEGKRLHTLDLDVTFSSPTDGIQRYDAPRSGENYAVRRSSYLFPYEAPTKGYKISLSEADAAVNAGLTTREQWRNSYENGNYLFRVRSSSVTNGIYGRIHGLFIAGIHGTAIPNVGFTFFLNPAGTRNLEWDSRQNLIKNVNHYRTFEYLPNSD